MSTTTHDAHHAHSAEELDHSHTHGWKGYLYVLLVLLFLTIITVGASRINFGSPTANVVIAMTIATLKASLVCLFFMHLKDDKPINGLIFVSTLMFLSIFLGFCLIDADSRWDIRPATYKGAVDAPATPLNDKEPVPASAQPAKPAAPAHGASH